MGGAAMFCCHQILSMEHLALLIPFASPWVEPKDGKPSKRDLASGFI
jgi:hypothetical protein